MKNNELNNRILKNVRNNIVVSNLEREENMKINKRKQFISLCAVSLLILSGSFVTVNAATDGKLVEDIKDVIVVKLDKDNYKVTTEKDSNGDEHVIYTVTPKDNDCKIDVDINKTELVKENIKAELDVNTKNVDGENVETEITLFNYNK